MLLKTYVPPGMKRMSERSLWYTGLMYCPIQCPIYSTMSSHNQQSVKHSGLWYTQVEMQQSVAMSLWKKMVRCIMKAVGDSSIDDDFVQWAADTNKSAVTHKKGRSAIFVSWVLISMRENNTKFVEEFRRWLINAGMMKKQQWLNEEGSWRSSRVAFCPYTLPSYHPFTQQASRKFNASFSHGVSHHDLLAWCQQEDMETIITRKW